MDLFKEYKVTFLVNGQPVEATVTVYVNEDSFYEIPDDACSLHSKQFYGIIKVSARAEGLEGFDSLGATALARNNAFNSKPFQNSVETALRENSMEVSALRDLQQRLETEYQTLTERAARFKKYAVKGSKS